MMSHVGFQLAYLKLTLTLWLQSFFLLPSNLHGDIFYISAPGNEFFFHVYCLSRTFFFGTPVSGRSIEASSLSTVQGNSITQFLSEKPGNSISARMY